jgi:hypothetical protein
MYGHNAAKRGIRGCFIALVAASALLMAAAPAVAQESDPNEDALLAAMISLVTAHDISILVGTLPFPVASLTGEFVEYGSNLALKALPPRLFAPADRSVNSTGAGPGYTADGCGIEFQLLSPVGGYTNMFGIANIRDPYTQLNPFRIYTWNNLSDSSDANAETRWGFLRSPRVYHANTDVEVKIVTPYELRKYNQTTGQFSDLYTPINTGAEAPQQVYLPIGRHPIEWRGATQLNTLTDVAVPGGMLLFNLLSELKNVYGGAKAAKVAKNTGIGEQVADEALDPEGAKRLSDGVLKFNDVWQKAFEDRQSRKAATLAQKATQELREKFRKEVAKVVKKALADALKNLAKSGFSSLDGASREQIAQVVGPVIADVMHETWATYAEHYPQEAFTIDFIISKLDEHAVPIIRRILARFGGGHLLKLLSIETAHSAKVQNITVWDNVPPTIDLGGGPMIIEATDFGGTRLARVHAQLLAMAEAQSSDNCGRKPEVTLSGPELLPLGTNQITFTARDRGPNPDDGKNYAPTAIKTIEVRDTQPPLLLAPPSKVILGSADLPLAQAQIGDAAGIDPVDVQPTVVNDAPATFAVNSRTAVNWTATDDSGNSANASQLITVKAANTAPTANAAMASAITAQQVDIRLTANDVDVLDGRADPLWFKINSAPQRGEFVAPLYPFFIEDYRTRPNDGLGQDYDPTAESVHSFITRRYCENDLRPPRNFVHRARFVHVTDDGIRYVLDEFFVCTDEDNASTEVRFSKWNSAGAFLGQLRLGPNAEQWPNGDAFRVDRDGFLYYVTDSEPSSSSNELFLWRCTLDWPENADLSASNRCVQGYKFENSSAPVVDARSLSYARVDSRMDVAYVVDDFSLMAFELLDTGDVRFLGEIGPKNAQDAVIDNWFGEITSVEVGSDGAVYANDATFHRIHKIAPTTRDADGELVPGDYIGWAGKCTGSGNNACEVDPAQPALGRSRGYSCTYAANSCTVATNARAGARQGQFNSPRYVSLDPRDILYVADYNNERVQRLSPDGSFAGEAVSSGSGINRGDRPSFVIGNMGRPASVAVNSTQFFVVDQQEQFVNVFGTLPFKDITDNAVTVTYVSDQDFPNPSVMADDSFTFSVTDGLDRSAAASVTVRVSRAFRAPEALTQTVTTAEDTSVAFTLPARDPDGILGKDFLGLDTLRYKLTRWPENGTLSGHGDSFTYTPNANFHGEDRLTFKVNDGRDDSNEGTLTFEVTPANDPPVVTIVQPERVALGFPLQLTATFTDDRVDEISTEVDDGHSDGYQGRIVWGDGAVETTGGFETEEGEVSTTGVIVVAPPNADSEGRAVSDHSYATTGSRNVQVCVTDSGGLQGCSQATINVEPLVSLGIGSVFYTTPLESAEDSLQEVADGAEFTFEITATNGAPEHGTGLLAAAAKLDLQLPSGLAVRTVATDTGECLRNGVTVACTLGNLAAGDEVKIAIKAVGPGNLIYNEARDFEGTFSTTSDALSQEIALNASVELVADTTDSDSDGMSDTFERTSGLNPAVDDSAGDPDGDGLSNVDEYRDGTSPRLADTDGDGASDGAEHTAGSNPLVDDIAPEMVVPPDVEVGATGTLTRVQLTAAPAVDFKDGVVNAVPDTRGPFPPGPNVVTWTAVDESGNRAVGHQFINVAPMVSFHVGQAVAEGATVRARLELNGPAVRYPVTVPYRVSGSASAAQDYQGLADGVAVIASGLSTDIPVSIVKDAAAESEETIVLTLGAPSNAIAGPSGTHTITITEQNLPPQVDILVEQQGRATTTIASGAGLIAFITNVRDDPAQSQAFDWSTSDPSLIDPVAVHDPSYLLDPAGLSAGLYDTRVSLLDNGVPPLGATASSLLSVVNAPGVLRSDEDTDGDGRSDAAEGPADDDGDRVADYLDDVTNRNMLRLGPDGRILETMPGIGMRLGASAFTRGSAYAAIKESEVAMDARFGFASDVQDFEITRLVPGGQAKIVVPLANALSAGAVLRKYAQGQWQTVVVDPSNLVRSAPGGSGACPPPSSPAYAAGLRAGNGCLELTLTDGGPNDVDGVADGVFRMTGGLAAPVSANSASRPQDSSTLTGDGEAIMARTRLHSASGDALLRSLTVQARGKADERVIDSVVLIHDINHDGQWDADDVSLATDRFTIDNGALTLSLQTPIELPAGDTDLLVVYVFGDVE